MAFTREDQILCIGPYPYDAKSHVGEGFLFESIDDMLASAPSAIFYPGMTVEDHNHNVSWQLYLDGSTWKARLYDGRFHVRCVYAGSDGVPIYDPGTTGAMQGLNTTDGVTVVEDDIVLVVNAHPNMNGVYIVHENTPWVRHSIFDEAIDNIRAVTFVVDEGTYFKNSQWVFTTIGDITPATLNSDYSIFVSSPSTFESYTWLNFEMLGRQYPKVSLTNGVQQVYSHDNLVLSDASSGDVLITRLVYHHIPNIEYRVIKTDSSSNKVAYNPDGSDQDIHVLLEQNDWMTVINPDNTITDASGFIVLSNRINKMLQPTAISSDGKLSIDVPSGYRLWQITGWVSSAGTADASLNIGTSSGASDIVSGQTYNDNGTKVTIDVDDNTITEVWVSESAPTFWNGNTVTFELLTIKE